MFGSERSPSSIVAATVARSAWDEVRPSPQEVEEGNEGRARRLDSSSLSDEPRETKRRKTTNVSMSTSPVMGPCAMDWEAAVAPVPDLSSVWQKSPIYGIGTNAMAGILAFLEPPEVHTILTMPLSKTWRTVYTAPQDLWKVLCLEAPFFAKIEDAPADSDLENSSLCFFPICSDTDTRHILGRYRLLYTSFVRCMRYLARIKDDAVNGRAPSALDNVAGLAPNLPFNGNASLQSQEVLPQGSWHYRQQASCFCRYVIERIEHLQQ